MQSCLLQKHKAEDLDQCLNIPLDRIIDEVAKLFLFNRVVVKMALDWVDSFLLQNFKVELQMLDVRDFKFWKSRWNESIWLEMKTSKFLFRQEN